MKYTINCRYGTYKVNIKNKILLETYKKELLLKRIYRAVKRIIAENKYLIYPIVLILIILIILGFILHSKFNINIYKLLDKKSYYEIILTTIMLPIITNTYIKENERHQKLLTQYSIYTSLVYESLSFIERIISNKVDYFVFFNEEKADAFLEKFNNNNCKHNITIEQFEYYCSYFLDNIKYQVSKTGIVIDRNDYDISYQELRNYISDELFKLKNNQRSFNNTYLINFINIIIHQIYPFIASYRRPWKKDIKIDNKIIKILKENAECEIGIDLKRYY